MNDILFKTEDGIFSYRIAGICIHNGKVLLHKAKNDDGYAFPGGHVAFGETNEETLVREFKEETGADITVGDLKWVAEIFFPLHNKPCHQICLYYMVHLKEDTLINYKTFSGKEQLMKEAFDIEFHWVPLERLKTIKLYPENAAALMGRLDKGVQHFVYKELLCEV